jgi:hypothetical protein
LLLFCSAPVLLQQGNMMGGLGGMGGMGMGGMGMGMNNMVSGLLVCETAVLCLQECVLQASSL